MLKTRMPLGGEGSTRFVLLIDSITQLAPDDAGAIVIAGSHGGRSAGEVALSVPLALVVFNDAGVGKDEAGIVALSMLQEHGVAAAAVGHFSARIGDAMDMWQHGEIAHLNDAARETGLRAGMQLRAALGAR